jgi:ADP-ribosyl-[dinitrogen reductase] hydrolase
MSAAWSTLHFVIGAIAGDIIGSVFESKPTKSTAFSLFHPLSRFTDDTVLTVATAWAILRDENFAAAYRSFGRRYPHAGYGHGFNAWLHAEDATSYRSFGNGSAMRVSPVGWACASEEDVLRMAAISAAVTHDHPEGIAGAQAVATAVWLARTTRDKKAIHRYITERFHYNLDRTIAEIRPTYAFDVTCQGSVPEAILAFLESDDVESAIRLAVSLGGDSDTQASIAGGIAQAHYGVVPWAIVAAVRARLPSELIVIVDEFTAKFSCLR